MRSLGNTLLGLAFILTVIALLWYVMWKFVFAPNPVIREFFDLNENGNGNGVNNRRKALSEHKKK